MTSFFKNTPNETHAAIQKVLKEVTDLADKVSKMSTFRESEPVKKTADVLSVCMKSIENVLKKPLVSPSAVSQKIAEPLSVRPNDEQRFKF